MTPHIAEVEPLHILLLAEGDPESPMGSGSGTPASLAAGLRELGHVVTCRDIEIRGLTRARIAAQTWSRDRSRWIARYHLSRPAFQARSANARRAIRSAHRVDAVLQYGGTFSGVGEGVPVFLFCDSNTLFSSTEPNSWGSALSKDGLREAVSLERDLYREAVSIFTMSDYIARSFVGDFSVPRNRVVPVGAGPNADPHELLSIERDLADRAEVPTVLFIGREFERKGGDVLLDAFTRLKRRLPDARLIVIGPREPVMMPAGGEWLGFLDRTQVDDWAKLRNAFSSASVFTLPARHEPFGLVVLEAMYAGLPVVASRLGALSEMVVHGETGYLVASGDAEQLCDALARAVEHESAIRMGRAGRARAISNYSWKIVTEKIAATMIDSIRTGRVTAS